MKQTPLAILSDNATKAHTRIQKDFAKIDPIVGINQSMRKSGIPADAMTIDCLKTNKRIIIILHDQQPDLINYQFSFRDKDPDSHFEQMAFNDVSADQLYQWIRDYFSQ